MGSLSSLENISIYRIGKVNKETDKNETVTTNAEERLKMSDCERKIKTALLLLCMTFVGFTSAAQGSTFVDVKLYLDTDTSTLSFMISSTNIGGAVGSLLCMFGGNKLSAEFTLGLFFCLRSLATMLTLAVRSVHWFTLCCTLCGFCFSLFICELQPYLINLWSNNRLKDSIIHSAQALWSVGVTIGPLFITPFLIKSTNPEMMHSAPEKTKFATKFNNYSDPNNFVSLIYDNLETSELVATTEENDYNRELANNTSTHLEYSGYVMYAFAVAGLPLLFSSLAFLVYSLIKGCSLLRAQKSNQKENQSSDKTKEIVSKHRHHVYLVLLLIYAVIYAVIETVPMSFLTLFVTTFLGWKSPERTLINTAYFGFLCLGRLVGIVASAWIKQRTLLLVSSVLAVLASVLFLFSTYSHVVVWLATALIGFGISTMWSGIILLAAQNMKMTQKVMALIMIVSSVGGTVGPVIAGILIQNYTPMWNVYMSLIVDIAGFLVFIVLCIVEKRNKNSEKSERKNLKDLTYKEGEAEEGGDE